MFNWFLCLNIEEFRDWILDRYFFGTPKTTRRRLCNGNHETKEVNIVSYSKHSDAFLVLARPHPPPPANLLSFALVGKIFRNIAIFPISYVSRQYQRHKSPFPTRSFYGLPTSTTVKRLLPLLPTIPPIIIPHQKSPGQFWQSPLHRNPVRTIRTFSPVRQFTSYIFLLETHEEKRCCRAHQKARKQNKGEGNIYLRHGTPRQASRSDDTALHHLFWPFVLSPWEEVFLI